MIAPDANLLIYAYSPADRFHAAAREWMQNIFSSTHPVGIPILSIHAFLRVVTHPRVPSGPISFQRAAEIINSWLVLPNVCILYPGDRHWFILQQLSEEMGLTGALVTDAALASIAIEHGATIHTNDRDFVRFPDLRWHNPLQA
jgi:hypothetical protein